jgi:glycosyltransferase involved in cell wall biosynthesis
MGDDAALRILHLRQGAGGGGGADRVLAQQLAMAVASPSVQPLVAYIHKPGESSLALRQPLAALGIPVYAVPGGKWVDLGQLAQIERLLRAQKIRILHSHDPKGDLMACELRRRIPGLKLVSTLHGWTRKGIKGRLYERLDQWSLRGFDAIIAVSDSIRREAAARGVENAMVVSNAIDPADWRPPARLQRSPESPFTVGFAGRFSPEKNPLNFIRVAALLEHSGCGFRFRMAGDGPELALARALADKLRLSGKLVLEGQLSSASLREFYADLDVLLLCSRTEGLPMTLLEAGAMALPVVATRVGGVAEVVRQDETGLIVPSGDLSAMAAAIERLRDHPRDAWRMGQRAHAHVLECFSLAAQWTRLEAIYRGLLESAE